MVLNLFSAVAMATMVIYMLCYAKMGDTRRMIWIPAASCGMELLTLGVITPAAHPVLTVLLVGLRVALLSVCVVAMRRDAAMARARSRRRAKLARELHAALHPLHEVPKVHATVPAVHTRIA